MELSSFLDIGKECPSEWLDTEFDNGEFLTDGERQYYYYEDQVDVLCNLGYVTNETTPVCVNSK